MKRDWDVIREVLIEIEEMPDKDRFNKSYTLGGQKTPEEMSKAEHALLLWQGEYVTGTYGNTAYGAGIIMPGLSWAGHDLLDTLRSKPVWEKIKTTAKDKGIELTFEAVKSLGSLALKSIIGS